jgi:hypothetical protein
VKRNSTISKSESLDIQPLWRRVLGWPSTKLDWWSIVLVAIYEIFMIINNALLLNLPDDISWRVLLLPFYGILLIIGLVAGVIGLIAVTRSHERSLLVWLTVLLGLLTLIFLIGGGFIPE